MQREKTWILCGEKKKKTLHCQRETSAVPPDITLIGKASRPEGRGVGCLQGGGNAGESV